MVSPQLLAGIGVFFLLIISHGYAYVTGGKHKDTEWKAKTYEQVAKDLMVVRDQEQAWQGGINAIVTKQDQKFAITRNALDIALNSLRSRPERNDTPVSCPTGTAPACGTGAGLCREDGEFLAREASTAKTLGIALEACYTAYDKVK